MTHLLFRGKAMDLLPWLKSVQQIEDALDDGIEIVKADYQRRLHYVVGMCHEATLSYLIRQQNEALYKLLADIRKENNHE
jgi:hypothetical protein